MIFAGRVGVLVTGSPADSGAFSNNNNNNDNEDKI